jgi:hypothetical protein
VANSEILARIERHMARGNELMEQIQRRDERLQIMFERHEAMFADLRQFMHEITLRVERGGREMVKEMRDLRAESQAQRQALLQVIDRMDRLDPGGAAA